MKRLLIFGAGQYGLVAKEIAEQLGEFDSIDFVDDNSKTAIAKLEDYKSLEYDCAFVAIGNPNIRKYWLNKIDKLVSLIHPKAIISPSAVIAEGCMVEAGAVISSNARVGKGTIVMANAVIGHDAIIGECCQLKYNCSVSERQFVPNETKIECNQSF